MNVKTISPHSGEVLKQYESTPVKEIEVKVSKARNAFSSWRDLSYDIRAECIKKAATEFQEKSQEFAGLIQSEMGKPIKMALGELQYYTASLSEYIETMKEAILPEIQSFKGGKSELHYVPLGVAGIITPWNFPFGMPITLIIPSLLAGNTVVFKPSEVTMGTGILLAEILQKHLPEDVLQLIIGDGEQGKAMINSDVDLIGFVGSRPTGKYIMEHASKRLLRLILELGGKDPMVVDKSADLNKAAKYAFTNSLINSGQVCCSVERIYVEESVHDKFVDILKEKMKTTAFDDEADEMDAQGNKIRKFKTGPMAMERQMKHVLAHIEDAKNQGATIHCGGEQRAGKGFYIKPTLVSNVKNSMKIMSDETFGPVISVQKVNNLQEGIDKANDTRYGLTATLWMGGDEQLASQEALKLEAGVIGLNGNFQGAAKVPWAGLKESGINHTDGITGMRNFLAPRTLTTYNS